jgi:hypothetical protein
MVPTALSLRLTAGDLACAGDRGDGHGCRRKRCLPTSYRRHSQLSAEIELFRHGPTVWFGANAPPVQNSLSVALRYQIKKRLAGGAALARAPMLGPSAKLALSQPFGSRGLQLVEDDYQGKRSFRPKPAVLPSRVAGSENDGRTEKVNGLRCYDSAAPQTPARPRRIHA